MGFALGSSFTELTTKIVAWSNESDSNLDILRLLFYLQAWKGGYNMKAQCCMLLKGYGVYSTGVKQLTGLGRSIKVLHSVGVSPVEPLFINGAAHN